MRKFVALICIWSSFIHCPSEAQPATLFAQLSPDQTGIVFENRIEETSEKDNILAYEYYYNGGGVAAGDLNNDGLPDLFFVSNKEPNHLYINQGNLHFKEMGKSAGVRGRKGWKTGVTLADVNADGWLDIYVCYSGDGDPDSRRNQLFINNRDLTFTESAKKYGLDDPSYSTHAAFFDFDRDGDLDCYLLNHHIEEFRNFENDALRMQRDPFAGDKLLQNNQGAFTDVSERAGIIGNPLGFGLGVAIADLNADGWPDIYVSNDYNEPDYLYFNRGDGTFVEKLKETLGHISHFSMGNAMADINNDGLTDILTLDMLPEDNRRQKLLQGPENYEIYGMMIRTGLHHQFMRNMLHLQRPNGSFSEIGQLSGISNTDWSWAPLVADFDNDGWKDIYITNGYLRDYTNRDFLRYWGDYLIKKAASGEQPSLLELVQHMPSTQLPNYAFKNEQNLLFSNQTRHWGLEIPSVSSGAVFADLDGDGDLEIIANNINQPALVFKNKAVEQRENHFLNIRLQGKGLNPFAIGARVRVSTPGGQTQWLEQSPYGGYESYAADVLHFGLGKADMATVEIRWSNGSIQTLTDVKADTTITIVEEARSPVSIHPPGVEDALFRLVPLPDTLLRHTEYEYNDFKRQPLLLTMLSHCGPALAAGDIDGDGRDDLFVGGAKWSPGHLFQQSPSGSFRAIASGALQHDMFSTDADAVFLDADNDGDQDLYIVSGGFSDYPAGAAALYDRLYMNDGSGHFMANDTALPPMAVSKSCVRPADIDGDGDLDLFVGGRVIPGQYPLPPRSYLLENDGKGHFKDITAEKAPALLTPGMVTDACWIELTADNRPDLLLCGDWMPLRVFVNRDSFTEITDAVFDRPYRGFWNCLLPFDMDRDGDMDLLAGNFGLNSQIRASEKEPAQLIYADFDGNHSIDPLLFYYVQGKNCPFPTRDELLDQIIPLRSRFTDYESYASAGLNDIFSIEELAFADTLLANHLETSLFENVNGRFERRALPIEAQFAPVHALCTIDANADGYADILAGGNDSGVRLRLGKMDANTGALFINNREGGFIPEPHFPVITGDVRSIVAAGRYVLLGVNNSHVIMLEKKEK